jgi:manganese/zinc/iron transport system substrate-binding protein
MRRVYLVIVIVLAALLLAACGQSAEQSGGDLSERPIKVVATIGMITDIAQIVGGDRVDVTGLMGPGIDPHLYRATEGDVSTLSEADVIFYNGLHLEAKMGEVLERMEGRATSVAVTSAIDESDLLSPEEFEGQHDPHVWFDVAMWMQAVDAVRDTYIEVDPGSADLYRANAEAYLEELQELHAYVHEQTARVPKEQRVLITAHDAFNYFGQAYNFGVRGLQGISTATEAGTGDVQELTGFIVENRIPAIFIESSVPVRNLEAVQAAVQAQGFEVSIGGELFSDAMGDPGTEEGTYIGMVRHNVDTIVSALLGQ